MQSMSLEFTEKVIPMSDVFYTISAENAYQTINELKALLASRGVRVKQNDVKEAISALIGFETSNVLDAKAQEFKNKQRAQSMFDKNGIHKTHKDLIIKSHKDPLKLYDYLRKHKALSTIFVFCENFEVTGGYRFRTDDVLFAKDEAVALKTILNWDEIINIEFKYWKDEGLKEVTPRIGGYWELTFIGDGEEQYLGDQGTRYLNTASDDDLDINDPDTPVEKVSDHFLKMLLEEDEFFIVHSRSSFESYLIDWIEEIYPDEDPQSENEFIKRIEKFIPYLGVNRIVNLEVGSVQASYLHNLKKYGADFSGINLLKLALSAGSVDTCRYLLEQGNELANLFQNSWRFSSKTHFHNEAFYCSRDSELCEFKKSFYATAKELGISPNCVDAEGNSPLHYAAECANGKLYEFLISIGANEKLKNKEGLSPKVIKVSTDKEQEELRKSEYQFLDEIFDVFR